MAYGLHDQLSNGYTRAASVMSMPASADEYLAEHRTTRKRAARAARLGYAFGEVDRAAHEDELYAINTSAERRQGRPMSAGYRKRPTFGPNPMLCPRHHVYTYGVRSDEPALVAYLWLYRSGELAMVSSILGHADHLADDVMYLLVSGVIEAQASLGGTCFYNLHASGTDGLRFFKERLGFAPSDVEWRA